MSTRVSSALSKATEFLRNERKRIGYFAVAVLIGVIGFEAGILRGSMGSASPITIEKPVGELAPANCVSDAQVAGASTDAGPDSAKPGATGCKFVGSKNSTLFHLPTCAAAKRIKPENIVCFADEDAAKAKGYKPGCLK
ncbi:MAG: hypothetical protein HGA31_03670 [Candidatus Moranbacteria bacterium]|nr:hypothetical protein [Candidatus Moranbacteria bacterium]